MNPIQRTLASPPLPVGASSGLVRLVMRGTDEVQRHGQRARDDLQRRRVRLHGHLPDSQSVRHAIDVAKEFSEKTLIRTFTQVVAALLLLQGLSPPSSPAGRSRNPSHQNPCDPASGPPESEVTKDITPFHPPQGVFQMTSESTRATLCFPSPCSTHPPIAPRGKQDEPERKEEDKKDDSDNSDLIELDPKPKQENTTPEEHRLSPNELDSDAEQQIGVVKQKDGSVDSSLKQELEQLVDTSASSASNADLLRIIDSLKATLVEVERQRSADKAKYEKELRTIGSVSAEEHSELTRLTEENARLTETMSEFQVRGSFAGHRQKHAGKEFGVDEAEDGDGAGEQHALTTERDTLKANLTATNQSLDESNQRIDTLSFEVSSLLAQNAELEHLLSKDWLITTDKQTECIGVSESAAQLSSIEKFRPASVTSHQPHYLDDIGDKIGSYMMHFTESDMRKVREYSYALEKGEEVNKTQLRRTRSDLQSQTTIQPLQVPTLA
ncbi:hypothetical protein BLNAU_18230 [Blattamonas nauphoetae]|uniref:Uncharacterized protein n=1 Tax=Blattamonas nauphoetae TaxID=2049346 RepID=A0ABQ9X4Z7_9EUKA|nr:hypothetical protein BLNAU_18230 [Blattamonas nauphoetae]